MLSECESEGPDYNDMLTIEDKGTPRVDDGTRRNNIEKRRRIN